MKKLSLLLLFWTCLLSAQKVEVLFTDKISIRAIELYDDKVWYAGSGSKFGYVDLEKPHINQQILLNFDKKEFRTLAQTKDAFYAISLSNPAEFYKINKKNLQKSVVFKDSTENVFYDALHFIDNQFGLAFSDPNKDCVSVAFTKNSGQSWSKDLCHCFPKFEEGEAAFAASNTNIASQKGIIWIATGGKKSRIFRMKNQQWEVFDTPFIQGQSSQGIYSIDFYGKNFGIAVGGDYTKQKENLSNIATTQDGGETWQIQANGNNAGYSTCVQIRPKSKGKEMIAIGDQHISYSSDFGKTWKVISEEKGFYTFKWLDRTTIILAGNGKIAKMNVNF